MEENIIAVVVYDQGNNTRLIPIVRGVPDTVEAMLHDVYGSNDGFIDLFDGALAQATSTDKVAKIGIGEWIHLDVGKKETDIYALIPGADKKVYRLNTKELLALTKRWARIRDDFKAACKDGREWNGIPTQGTISPEDTMYWSADTDKVGRYKDLPEGQAWFKRIQEDGS
jgi:hypothetical protein